MWFVEVSAIEDIPEYASCENSDIPQYDSLDESELRKGQIEGIVERTDDVDLSDLGVRSSGGSGRRKRQVDEGETKSQCCKEENIIATCSDISETHRYSNN